MRRLHIRKDVVVTIDPKDLDILDKAYNVAKDLFADFCEVDKEDEIGKYMCMDEKANDIIEAISDFLLAYKRSEE